MVCLWFDRVVKHILVVERGFPATPRCYGCKVYVAVIAAEHALVGGASIGQHPLVFLNGQDGLSLAIL